MKKNLHIFGKKKAGWKLIPPPAIRLEFFFRRINHNAMWHFSFQSSVGQAVAFEKLRSVQKISQGSCHAFMPIFPYWPESIPQHFLTFVDVVHSCLTLQIAYLCFRIYINYNSFVILCQI